MAKEHFTARIAVYQTRSGQADTHEAAGDKILPGWTWGKLRMVNRIYEFVFFLLWIGGSVIAFRALHPILKEGMYAHGTSSEESSVKG